MQHHSFLRNLPLLFVCPLRQFCGSLGFIYVSEWDNSCLVRSTWNAIKILPWASEHCFNSKKNYTSFHFRKKNIDPSKKNYTSFHFRKKCRFLFIDQSTNIVVLWYQKKTMSFFFLSWWYERFPQRKGTTVTGSMKLHLDILQFRHDFK